MRLADLLFTQGFGTRRVCAGLVEQGHVRIGGEVVGDPWLDVDADSARFEVDGAAWRYREKAYLMLHKPAGYECSLKPSGWPSIYTLLPAPLRQRPGKGVVGVQAVGRLDQDTTGLLLLTDDGAFIHRMNSPRHHVPKVYEVGTDREVTDAQVAKLLQGVQLEREPAPVRAAACVQTASHALRLTLTEGKYHQVKRMLAAVGNHVVRLHRSQVGGLVLPADLAAGEWRWLEEPDLEALAR